MVKLRLKSGDAFSDPKYQDRLLLGRLMALCRSLSHFCNLCLLLNHVEMLSDAKVLRYDSLNLAKDLFVLAVLQLLERVKTTASFELLTQGL